MQAKDTKLQETGDGAEVKQKIQLMLTALKIKRKKRLRIQRKQ